MASVAVKVGSAACPVVTVNDNQITCSLPTGTGSALAVQATVNGQTSNSVSFSYNAPILASLSPATGPPAGNVALVLSGANFGSLGLSLVSIGGVNCPITAQNDSSITCTLPVGEGTGKSVVVLTNGQSSTNLVTFSYNPPVISSTTPAFQPTQVFHIVCHFIHRPQCLQGGAVVTLTGSNFGVSSTVSIGGVSCPVILVLPSQITCSLPAGVGTVSVVVTTVSQVSNTLSYTYGSPSLTSGRSGSFVSLSVFTFRKKSLPYFWKRCWWSVNYACRDQFWRNSRIYYPGWLSLHHGSVFLSLLCAWFPILIQSIWSDVLAVCSTPSGQGLNQVIQLSAGGQTTSQTNVVFNYSAPAFTSVCRRNER